jgi:hypothetical protein
LSSLEARKKELKEKIETLQKVPIPVADHFAKLIESGEKRNARRDYILFIRGWRSCDHGDSYYNSTFHKTMTLKIIEHISRIIEK